MYNPYSSAKLPWGFLQYYIIIFHYKIPTRMFCKLTEVDMITICPYGVIIITRQCYFMNIYMVVIYYVPYASSSYIENTSLKYLTISLFTEVTLD